MPIIFASINIFVCEDFLGALEIDTFDEWVYRLEHSIPYLTHRDGKKNQKKFNLAESNLSNPYKMDNQHVG